jgi:hypothetical protein
MEKSQRRTKTAARRNEKTVGVAGYAFVRYSRFIRSTRRKVGWARSFLVFAFEAFYFFRNIWYAVLFSKRRP